MRSRFSPHHLCLRNIVYLAGTVHATTQPLARCEQPKNYHKSSSYHTHSVHVVTTSRRVAAATWVPHPSQLTSPAGGIARRRFRVASARVPSNALNHPRISATLHFPSTRVTACTSPVTRALSRRQNVHPTRLPGTRWTSTSGQLCPSLFKVMSQYQLWL
jgi:hypothetical protein